MVNKDSHLTTDATSIPACAVSSPTTRYFNNSEYVEKAGNKMAKAKEKNREISPHQPNCQAGIFTPAKKAFRAGIDTC